MSTLASVALCAALFAGFGLVLRAARRAPGCSACSSACHRKESHDA